MGREYGIRCKNCDYKFTVDIGHGRRECGFLENEYDSDTSMFYSYIEDKKILDNIESLRTKHCESLIECGCIGEDEWNGHGRSTYLCPQCSLLYTRHYFKLMYPGGEYEPDYLCPACSSGLLNISVKDSHSEEVSLVDKNGNALVWRCHHCGGNELISDNGFCVVMYD